MWETILEPVVVVVSILGFTFYFIHRVEDKVTNLSTENSKDHGVVNQRLLKIEDKLGIPHIEVN